VVQLTGAIRKGFPCCRLGPIGSGKVACTCILQAQYDESENSELCRIDGQCRGAAAVRSERHFRRGARRGRNRRVGQRTSRSRGRGTRGDRWHQYASECAAKRPSNSGVTAGSLSPTSWTPKISVPSLKEAATGGFYRRFAQKDAQGEGYLLQNHPGKKSQRVM
jgi:hypothetical protein